VPAEPGHDADGQYPSLHGEAETDGIAKRHYDPAMNWIDPDQVPTVGDSYRAAGTAHYRGKWHVSHADLLVPGVAYYECRDDVGGVTVEGLAARSSRRSRTSGTPIEIARGGLLERQRDPVETTADLRDRVHVPGVGSPGVVGSAQVGFGVQPGRGRSSIPAFWRW
jgi:hypothetical protein